MSLTNKQILGMSHYWVEIHGIAHYWSINRIANYWADIQSITHDTFMGMLPNEIILGIGHNCITEYWFDIYRITHNLVFIVSLATKLILGKVTTISLNNGDWYRYSIHGLVFMLSHATYMISLAIVVESITTVLIFFKLLLLNYYWSLIIWF